MNAHGTPTPVRSVSAKEVSRFLRDRRREKCTREDLFDQLYWLYCAALFVGFAALYFGTLLGGTSEAVEPGGLLVWTERLGPPALLLVTSAGLRWATWQGPAVFPVADLVYLISSPLPRAPLVRTALYRGLAAGTLVGSGIGLLLFAVSASLLDIGLTKLFAAGVIPFAALGLFVAAAGWQVERSPILSRAVLGAGPLVTLLAVLLVLAYSFLPAEISKVVAGVALFSGPWGWALAPTLAAGDYSTVSWVPAAVLLGAATAVMVGWALATADSIPTEELLRRANLRRGLYASLYTTDFRGAALAGRSATQRLTGNLPQGRRLPRPRHPLLAVPWRDLLWTSRNPGRLDWSLTYCGGGLLAVLTYPQDVFVVLLAVVLGYLGASRLVEPLRVESDAPGAALLLPYRWTRLMLLHTPVPTILLVTGLMLCCVAASVAGFISGAALPAALVLSVPAAAALVCCAALAARRSRTLPLYVMEAAVAAGDAGGLILVQWYALGPILALLALGLPALFLSVAAQGSSVSWGMLLGVAVYLSLFATAGLWWISHRCPPE